MNDSLFFGLKKNKFCVKFVFTAISLLIYSVASLAGESSTTLNFTANFIPGTCDISIEPKSINWGAQQSLDIKNAGVQGFGPEPFAVKYENCNGYGVKPTLNIKGTAFYAGINLFSNTNNTDNESAIGYGIRLSRSESANIALSNNDNITVGSENESLSVLNNTSTEFLASLSCGNDCDASTLRNGNLRATVTFQFLYD